MSSFNWKLVKKIKLIKLTLKIHFFKFFIVIGKVPMLLPRPLLLICIFVLSGTRLPAWRRPKASQLVKSTLLASLKGQVNITGFQFLLTPLLLLLLLLLRRSEAVGNAAIVAIFQRLFFVEFKLVLQRMSSL